MEDVFNDSQIIQNQKAREIFTQKADYRVSPLPEVLLDEQPGDGSSSENIADEIGSNGPSYLLQQSLTDSKLTAEATLTKKPQSTFAKALAMKKQTSLDDQKAVALAAENASTPKRSSQEIPENPFDIIESVNEDSVTHIMVENLEVVTEDTFEDRYSLASSATKRESVKVSSLPMKREDFIRQYQNVLTEQEKKELSELTLLNDIVYYASDVPTRANAASAVTNSDDDDGYYVI